MGIGERIRTVREKYGLTQSKLGELIGTDGNTISRWEREVMEIKAETVSKIAIKLNTSVSYLMGETNYIPVTGVSISPKTMMLEVHQPIIFEYSKGDEKTKLTIPPETSEEKIKAAISEAVRAVTGEVPHESGSEQQQKQASSGDT